MLDQLSYKIKANIINNVLKIGGCTREDFVGNKIIAVKTNLDVTDVEVAKVCGELCNDLVNPYNPDKQCIIYYFKLSGFGNHQSLVGKIIKENNFSHYYCVGGEELYYFKTIVFYNKLNNFYILNMN